MNGRPSDDIPSVISRLPKVISRILFPQAYMNSSKAPTLLKEQELKWRTVIPGRDDKKRETAVRSHKNGSTTTTTQLNFPSTWTLTLTILVSSSIVPNSDPTTHLLKP